MALIERRGDTTQACHRYPPFHHLASEKSCHPNLSDLGKQNSPFLPRAPYCPTRRHCRALPAMIRRSRRQPRRQSSTWWLFLERTSALTIISEHILSRKTRRIRVSRVSLPMTTRHPPTPCPQPGC